MLKWAAASFGGLTAMSLAYLVIPPIAEHSSMKAQLSSPGPMGLPMEREEGSGTARYAAVGLGREIAPATRTSDNAKSGILPVADISDVKRASSQRWTLRIVDPFDTGSSTGGYATNSSAIGPALTRRIQNEIRRVGCGGIRVTGYWNKQTKAAIGRFVANRNAALPTDKPDVVLLSLLRTYKGSACGRSCNGVWTSGGQCRQIEASLGAKKFGPKAVPRPAPSAVGTNWAVRTTISQNEPPPIATTFGTGRIETKGPYGDESTTRTTRRLVTGPSTISEGRMALGARSPYQQPQREIPPVTVQSRTFVGPTEPGAGSALRLDADNADALRGAAGLSRPDLKRQRKSRPRRTHRRRSNWRARVFNQNLDNGN